MASIAINGLGRIGRAALKILEQTDGAEVVAVNDLIPPDNLAYLLRYDTAYGRWRRPRHHEGPARPSRAVRRGRHPGADPRRVYRRRHLKELIEEPLDIVL